MVNRIWEMTALVKQSNTDDEPLLWNECMRLLQGNPEEFLKETISSYPDVDEGFSSAKTWLTQQGLSATDGTLSYALQFIAYTILLEEKDNENKPENLTNEWLQSKKNDLNNSYVTLPSFHQSVLDRLGTSIVALGRPFENSLAARTAATQVLDSTIKIGTHLFFLSLLTIVVAKLTMSPDGSYNYNNIGQKVKFCFSSGLLTTLLIGGKAAAAPTYFFFDNRQRHREQFSINSYLPKPEDTPESGSQTINP